MNNQHTETKIVTCNAQMAVNVSALDDVQRRELLIASTLRWLDSEKLVQPNINNPMVDLNMTPDIWVAHYHWACETEAAKLVGYKFLRNHPADTLTPLDEVYAELRVEADIDFHASVKRPKKSRTGAESLEFAGELRVGMGTNLTASDKEAWGKPDPELVEGDIVNALISAYFNDEYGGWGWEPNDEQRLLTPHIDWLRGESVKNVVSPAVSLSAIQHGFSARHSWVLPKAADYDDEALEQNVIDVMMPLIRSRWQADFRCPFEWDIQLNERSGYGGEIDLNPDPTDEISDQVAVSDA